MNRLLYKTHSFIQLRICSYLMQLVFAFQMIVPTQSVYAQTKPHLPSPGTMVSLSAPNQPTTLRGITLNLENPLLMDFIIDPGDDHLEEKLFEQETEKLIKYFLAALTVPEDEMWVNLSPYEKDRIIPGGLGSTEMGRDLLAQDYMLKQLTSTLMNPNDDIGSEFWKRVYAQAQKEYGTTEIPINTFNKIWIVPESANVHVEGQSVFVVSSHLKVMLEEDYLALESNQGNTKHGVGDIQQDDSKVLSGVSLEVVRNVLIPEIEKEVNQGDIFSNLRQIFNSMILAAWYKKNLKESFLGQIYVDQNKMQGIDLVGREVNQDIYNQYVEAFKKGTVNFIREDYDEITQEVIVRKYFSGGISGNVGEIMDEQPFNVNRLKGTYIASSGLTVQTKNPQAIFDSYDMKKANVSVAYSSDLSKRFVFNSSENKTYLDGVEVGPDDYQGLLKKDISELIEATESDSQYENVITYSYGNFMLNDWFIIYDGSQQNVFSRSGEPVFEREYSMVVVWNDGSISSENVWFREKGKDQVKVFLSDSQEDRSAEIKTAFFGQRIVQDGSVTPWSQLYNQFSDLYHIFIFPQFMKEVDGKSEYGVTIGRKELFDDMPKEGFPVDRKLLKQVIGAEGYLELDLSSYLVDPDVKDIEDIKNHAIETRGYQENISEGDLKEGEYRIQDNILKIKLIKSKYPHNLLGITQNGNLVMMNFLGDKKKNEGHTIEDLQETIISRNHNLADPIVDVFLLANSVDVFKRENGEIVEEESVQNSREKYSAVITVAEKQNVMEEAFTNPADRLSEWYVEGRDFQEPLENGLADIPLDNSGKISVRSILELIKNIEEEQGWSPGTIAIEGGSVRRLLTGEYLLRDDAGLDVVIRIPQMDQEGKKFGLEVLRVLKGVFNGQETVEDIDSAQRGWSWQEIKIDYVGYYNQESLDFYYKSNIFSHVVEPVAEMWMDSTGRIYAPNGGIEDLLINKSARILKRKRSDVSSEDFKGFIMPHHVLRTIGYQFEYDLEFDKVTREIVESVYINRGQFKRSIWQWEWIDFADQFSKVLNEEGFDQEKLITQFENFLTNKKWPKNIETRNEKVMDLKNALTANDIVAAQSIFDQLAPFGLFRADTRKVILNAKNYQRAVEARNYLASIGFEENIANRIGIDLDAILSERPDTASSPGGIDLNSNLLDLQTDKDGIQFTLPLEGIDLENIKVDGFSPVIYQIVPTNVPQLMGYTDAGEAPRLSQL